MKYFIIGFNKCGTTSIHDLFIKNNLKSQHYTCWNLNLFDCFSDTGNTPFIKFDDVNNLILHGGGLIEFSKLINFTKNMDESIIKYNSNITYTNYNHENIKNLIHLEKKYEESIFILNTRPLKNWLISRFEHGVRLYLKNTNINYNWAYPYTKELCIKWIHDRNNYYKDILNYFKDKPNKLVIVDINDPNWINFISNELNIKPYDCNKNIRKKSDQFNNILNVVNESFRELNYDIIDEYETLLKDKDLKTEYLKLFKTNIVHS